MIKSMKKYETVEEYLRLQSPQSRRMLKQIRRTIKELVPEAEELISYNMPAFKYLGILAFYAGCRQHIGFYPTASPIVQFKKELEKYQTSKGAIQFPIGEPLPLSLIRKMIRFKKMENIENHYFRTKARG